MNRNFDGSVLGPNVRLGNYEHTLLGVVQSTAAWALKVSEGLAAVRSLEEELTARAGQLERLYVQLLEHRAKVLGPASCCGSTQWQTASIRALLVHVLQHKS